MTSKQPEWEKQILLDLSWLPPGAICPMAPSTAIEQKRHVAARLRRVDPQFPLSCWQANGRGKARIYGKYSSKAKYDSAIRQAIRHPLSYQLTDIGKKKNGTASKKLVERNCLHEGNSRQSKRARLSLAL